MFTTKTKMLFNQLPGMMVYDNDEEIWTQAVEWRGEAFRPNADADNSDYLKARALAFIGALPPHLRTGFPSLELADYRIDQPRDIDIRIFPRMFECTKCGRTKSWPDGDNVHRSYRFGFKCAGCGNRRFRQSNLVFIHHCGAIASPRLPKCNRQGHKFEHLYLVNLGGQRAGDIEVRCMGPDGTKESPACNELNEPLFPDSDSHPRSGCPHAKRLEREFDEKDIAAQALIANLKERNVQLKPAKDPINYRAVGLDLIVPNVSIPANIAKSEAAVGRLAAAHVEQHSLSAADFADIVVSTEGDSPRITTLKEMLKGYREALATLPGPAGLEEVFWNVAKASSQLKDPPASAQSAEDEIEAIAHRTEGLGILDEREPGDALALASHLIEMSHIQGLDSGFKGLSATSQRLAENHRDFAYSFEQAARRARQLGLEDIQLSEMFNIVRLQVGYTRGTYEPDFAVLNPFTSRGADETTRFYGRQSSTEAILFKLKPTSVVQWVHETWPDADYATMTTAELGEPKTCRQWLLDKCEFASLDDYEPIEHRPTRHIVELIHTLSHQFMRSSASFSGIEESNVKEMLFPAMPGFILYKAQHGDFNLGGFVSLYEQHLGEWIERAVHRGEQCHNDPVCRNGKMRDNVIAASCYGCLTGGEHSCTLFNHNLDRATLVSTARARQGESFQGFWPWLHERN